MKELPGAPAFPEGWVYRVVASAYAKYAGDDLEGDYR